ncbi:ABC transporter ATP-binding protein [Hyphomicrobiales bacterium]|nr:ABC transporter ATP-binding protein [Hyphomicrobiales bacterium]CAH1695298.1 ABC transporter ATP-binding protein [Hyphomicrobiales bacterium]
MKGILGAAVFLAAFAAAQLALAQEPVKIGLITTLSGPPGYLGEDMRDGFKLAIAEEGGKLGGVPVELLVEDDGLNPATGKQIAERMIKRDNAAILTGIIFSNVLPVVAPVALAEKRFYVSSNAGPSTFAGARCHENYFVSSWENDAMHEAAGIAANKAGYKKAVVMVPNYQAGKDAVAGFKRFYKGEITDEIYTQLNQTDYAAEIAKIRSLKPEVLFYFLPGGLSINFLKQYSQAGLTGAVPIIAPMVSMEARILQGVGEAANGIRATAHWNSDLDNAANKQFVADYRKTYNREPTPWAAQGYDAARMIGSALKATGGKVLEDQEGFRTAMRAAKFEAVRGAFKLAGNNHPIQNWYLLEGRKDDRGQLKLVTVETIATDHGDAYAQQCKLK